MCIAVAAWVECRYHKVPVSPVGVSTGVEAGPTIQLVISDGTTLHKTINI